MYLKCHARVKNGKEHRYWSIAEKRRCAGGRIVDRHVLYLGEINDSQHAAWLRCIEAFEGDSPQQTRLALTGAPVRVAHRVGLRGQALLERVEVDVGHRAGAFAQQHERALRVHDVTLGARASIASDGQARAQAPQPRQAAAS